MSRKLQNGSLFTNVTALNPIIGYKASSKVAKEAHATGRSVYDIVIEQGLLSKERQIRFYADKLNVSPAYLSRLVKEISGSTIKNTPHPWYTRKYATSSPRPTCQWAK